MYSDVYDPAVQLYLIYQYVYNTTDTPVQYCGGGPFPFLCGSDSRLSKIPPPAPTIFPIKLGKINNFHGFKKIFMFLKT
jgi:hypothetical protein